MERYEQRVELCLHTKFSLYEGLCDIREAINFAIASGHRALAIADFESCNIFPEAAMYAGDRIKILYGLAPLCIRSGEGLSWMHYVTLIAKNATGLKNLYKLMSVIAEDKRGWRWLTHEVIDQYREGLLVGSAENRGEFFPKAYRDGPDDELKELIAFYDFIQIQPSATMSIYTHDEVIKANKRLLALADELGKPVVATGDVCFIKPEDEIGFFHEEDTDPDDAVTFPFPAHFRSTEEMLEEFSYLGDRAREVVIDNPNKIADSCDWLKPIPEGLHPATLDDAKKELRTLACAGLRNHYGENPPGEIIDQVEKELRFIQKWQYESIYMAVHRLISGSHDNGFPTIIGGSVGASLVAFLIGITEINPLQAHYHCPKCNKVEFVDTVRCGHDLPDAICPDCGTNYLKDGFSIPYETFFGSDDEKMPDIDISFSPNYRETAISEIYKMFGEDHVLRGGLFSTFSEDNAKNYVEECLANRRQQVDNAVKEKMIRSHIGRRGIPYFDEIQINRVVVFPKDSEFEDFTPVRHSRYRPSSTYFRYADLREHLFGLNILEHSALTMLSKLEAITGVHHKSIPFNDEATMSLFQSEDGKVKAVKTECIPEFQSNYAKSLIAELNPKTLEELIRISGMQHGENCWDAVARTVMSYQLAWYKAHYPQAFYEVCYEVLPAVCHDVVRPSKKKRKRS